MAIVVYWKYLTMTGSSVDRLVAQERGQFSLVPPSLFGNVFVKPTFVRPDHRGRKMTGFERVYIILCEPSVDDT